MSKRISVQWRITILTALLIAAAWDWDWRSCRRLSGCMAAQCALNRAQIREQQFW